MNREMAWNLLCEYTKNENLRKHALAVEACMKAYARKFGEDEETWAVVGVIHDFDYERYPSAEAGHAIDLYLDRIYAGTKMGDRDARLASIDKSTADLAASNDSFIALAAALEPLAESMRETAKNRAGVTKVTNAAWLLVGFGSGVSEEAAATLVYRPAVVALNSIVSVLVV